MDCMIADVGTVFMSAAGWIITYGQNMLCPSPCTKGRTRISPVAIWNINAGTHIHNRNKEVLIWETKFRRCINIWHRGCSVCERVQWWRVSVPPSLKLWWANLGCVRAVEVLGSRTGDCFQRRCSLWVVEEQGYRAWGRKWERRDSSSRVAEIERLEGTALDGRSRSFNS